MSSENLRIYQTTTEPAQREHPKIDFYFDAAIHVVKRAKELAWESKELVVALLILILLIQHSFHVLMK